MSSQQADEETPLLQPEQQDQGRTPLPWRQFSIILFLQLGEPLTSQLISPFAPQLIREIGITNGDETKVGYYVGLMHSLFFAAQALTVLHWSRLSDHIGRKPVILTGLFGLSASMYCFGLSKTFMGLVLSRALNGALNGNVGVIKSMMVEITDSTNLAQAYAYAPIAWSTGSTLGPLIGGALSHPADQFPNIFGNWEFFKTYPYFLACAVPATYAVIAWILTATILEETVTASRGLGSMIKATFRKQASDMKTAPPSTTACQCTESLQDQSITDTYNTQPLPLRDLLIPRVIIAAGNYGTMSLVDIAFRTFQPLFYSTPIELGGLGLSPPDIGKILGVYGVLNGLFQVFFFADLHDYFGSKIIYTAAIFSGIPTILTFPLISVLARSQGVGIMVWSVVGLQVVLSIVLNLGFACVFIYLSAASPNRASLGATNGIAQTLVSVMRCFGPATTNSLFSLTIQHNYLGGWLVYYFMLGLVLAALIASSFLPRRLWTD